MELNHSDVADIFEIVSKHITINEDLTRKIMARKYDFTLDELHLMLKFLIHEQYFIPRRARGTFKTATDKANDYYIKIYTLRSKLRFMEYKLTKLPSVDLTLDELVTLSDLFKMYTEYDLDCYIDKSWCFLSETDKLGNNLCFFNLIESKRLLLICSIYIKNMTGNEPNAIEVFNNVVRIMGKIDKHLLLLEADCDLQKTEQMNENQYDLKFTRDLKDFNDQFPPVEMCQCADRE